MFMVTNVGLQVQWFSHVAQSQYPPHPALLGLRSAIISFVLGEHAEGFRSLSCRLLLIVSLRVWGMLS